jgi:hypothetical protein
LKKSAETLLPPGPDPPPKAPASLKRPGKSLWTAIQSAYNIDDPGGIAHLLTACRAEDDIRRWRAIVQAEGALVTDRFGQRKAHPLLSAVRDAESVKMRALRALESRS